MSRRLLALCWLGVVAVVAVALAMGAHRTHPASLAARTAQVAALVRCPVCDGLSVEESSAPIARALRNQIRGELAAGRSAAQVESGLATRYGESILLSPPRSGLTLGVWVVPLVAVAGAVGGLGLFFWKRTRTLQEVRPGVPSPGEPT